MSRPLLLLLRRYEGWSRRSNRCCNGEALGLDVRDMPADERERNAHIASHYQDRAARFRKGLRSTT